MSNTNDEYWDSTFKPKFNFDDEDLSTSQIDYVANDVFSPKQEETNIAIEYIISQKCLEYLLADTENQNLTIVPPVEEVIKKMIHGQRFFLGVYKSYKDKLSLLDAALKTYNGDIILRVTEFLRQTLKFKIFCKVLIKRKVAFIQYSMYIKAQGNMNELENLYMATGFTFNIRDLFFCNKRSGMSKRETLNKLKCFISSHSQLLNRNENKLLDDYAKFLEWQIGMNENSSSVIEQLAVVCMRDLQEGAGDDNVNKFKTQFKISDIQFEWTIINCLSSLGLWKKLMEMFMKQNWLTKKQVLKTSINHEYFILGISRHNPQKNVLEQFISCLNNSEKSLALAEKFNCHKFLIEYYISQRDRTALLSYVDKVAFKSEEYYLIRKALDSQDKKWKN